MDFSVGVSGIELKWSVYIGKGLLFYVPQITPYINQSQFILAAWG